MARIRLKSAACLLAGAGLAPTLAFAGALGVVPYVEIGVEHDSNVFRVHDDEQARQITGDTERSDTITTGALGVAAEWPISRQRIVVGGEVRENRYDRFQQLDSSENEVRAALEFEVGSIVYGTASYRRARRLDDFSDLDSDEPNFVTETNPQLETFVEVTPSWRVRTQVGHLRFDRSLEVQQQFELEENRATLELQHLGGPQSIVGVGVEYIDGEYPNRDEGGALSREFEQRTAFVSTNWRYSGVSSFRGQLGYTQRDSSGAGDRDFDGVTGRLGYERTVSGKTRLFFEVFRQIFSVDDVDANFVREDGALARLLWRYSPKLALSSTLRYVERDFQALPGFSNSRQDELSEVVAELIYEPYRVFAFIFSVAGESRDSNEEDEAYDALRAGLTLRVSLDTE